MFSRGKKQKEAGKPQAPEKAATAEAEDSAQNGKVEKDSPWIGVYRAFRYSSVLMSLLLCSLGVAIPIAINLFGGKEFYDKLSFNYWDSTERREELLTVGVEKSGPALAYGGRADLYRGFDALQTGVRLSVEHLQAMQQLFGEYGLVDVSPFLTDPPVEADVKHWEDTLDMASVVKAMERYWVIFAVSMSQPEEEIRSALSAAMGTPRSAVVIEPFTACGEASGWELLQLQGILSGMQGKDYPPLLLSEKFMQAWQIEAVPSLLLRRPETEAHVVIKGAATVGEAYAINRGQQVQAVEERTLFPVGAFSCADDEADAEETATVAPEGQAAALTAVAGT